jgi:DnaJ-class molecular chaperone
MSEKLPAPCEHCAGTELFHEMSCEECRGKGYRLVVDGRATKPSRPQRRSAAGRTRREQVRFRRVPMRWCRSQKPAK